jgi:hypothetical protein
MTSLLSNLSAQQLRQAASIRETIEQLEKDFTDLLAVTGDAPVTVRKRGRPAKSMAALAPPAPRQAAKKRAKPGQVKNTIINLLKHSGKKGITVKELAVKLGHSQNRVHTWFYYNRKSLKQIKKLGPGKYAWTE